MLALGAHVQDFILAHTCLCTLRVTGDNARGPTWGLRVEDRIELTDSRDVNNKHVGTLGGGYALLAVVVAAFPALQTDAGHARRPPTRTHREKQAYRRPKTN